MKFFEDFFQDFFIIYFQKKFSENDFSLKSAPIAPRGATNTQKYSVQRDVIGADFREINSDSSSQCQGRRSGNEVPRCYALFA